MSINLKDYLRDTVLAVLSQRGLYFDVAAVRACLDTARIPWQAATVNRYMLAMVRGGCVWDAGKAWYSFVPDPFVL
ncbi:MAG: hypothetical protein NTV22_05650, partial [bacterium]|nr:hypothetical protein [bacterium]